MMSVRGRDGTHISGVIMESQHRESTWKKLMTYSPGEDRGNNNESLAQRSWPFWEEVKVGLFYFPIGAKSFSLQKRECEPEKSNTVSGKLASIL